MTTLPLVWRSFTVALVQEKVAIASKMKKNVLEVGFHIVSQTEVVMYCREERSCRGELVMHINFSFSVVILLEQC